MWRGLVAFCALVGCNTLLGVHEFERKDAGTRDTSVSCSSEIVECGQAHAVACGDGACECAAGYAFSDGRCTWIGVVANPEVNDPSKWALEGGATIEAIGTFDPGRASLPCAAGAIVQKFTMPRYADAEPLVATLTYDRGGGGAPEVGMGLGTVWHDQPWGLGNPGLNTIRSCLGAGEYAPPTSEGRGATLQLVGEAIKNACSQPGLLDHFEIVPANVGECPAPGRVLNGDVESAGGWETFGQTAANIAAITPAVGEAGTQGLRLFVENACQAVAARTLVSVPDTQSPALAFHRRATRNGNASAPTFLSASLARRPLQVLDAATATERYCLPPSLRGGVFALELTVNDQNTACGTQVNVEAAIDNVLVYDDPACGTDAIADRSFESGYGVFDVAEVRGPNGGSQIDSIAVGNAPHGARVLRFSRTNSCGLGAFHAAVIVPPSSGTNGPAVTFQYNTATSAPYPLVVSSGTFTGGTGLMDGLWHPALACLDPARVGRSVRVSLIWQNQAGGCGPISSTSASVDDLVLTTSSMCPAQ